MRAVKDIMRSLASASVKYWNFFFSKKKQSFCQRLAE